MVKIIIRIIVNNIEILDFKQLFTELKILLNHKNTMALSLKYDQNFANCLETLFKPWHSRASQPSKSLQLAIQSANEQNLTHHHQPDAKTPVACISFISTVQKLTSSNKKASSYTTNLL